MADDTVITDIPAAIGPYRNRVVGLRVMPVGELLDNPRNWRQHPPAQKAGLDAVMRQVGVIDVVRYNAPTNRLWDGHLRKELFGADPATPVLVLVTDLSEEEEAVALATYDPLAGMARADRDLLAALLAELEEAPAVVEDESLDGLLRRVAGEAGIDWRALADPPYLVDYDGTNHPHKWNEPDANKDWSDSYHDWDDAKQGEALYDGFVATAVAHAITEDAAWYCWHASRNQAMLERVWERYGAFVHQQIIWVKDRPILTRSWYMWQHEPCFFGWVKGQKPARTSEDYPASVWTFPTVAAGERTDHPTSKPVELFAIPMAQHTRLGEVCYEPFSGSGSQQVAGEQNGRLVYGLELQPQFVAVILERLAGMGLVPRWVEGA